MRDHDDGLSVFLIRSAQQLNDLVTVLFIQISGWFICQNNCRTVDQCPPDGYALLLSAGEFFRKMRFSSVKSQLIDQFIQTLLSTVCPSSSHGNVMFSSTFNVGIRLKN